MILRHHPTDEFPQLGVGTGTPGLARDPSPVSAASSSVPGDDGGGSDDRQCTGPVGPNPAQGHPEETVGRPEAWPAPAVSEGGELLAEGEILEYERRSRECQGANDPKGPPEKQRHSGRMRAHIRDGKRTETGGWSFGEAQAPYPCRSAYSTPFGPGRTAVAIVSQFQGDGVFGTDTRWSAPGAILSALAVFAGVGVGIPPLGAPPSPCCA